MKKLFLFFILLATVAIGAQAQTFGQMCCPGIEIRYQIQADQKSVALVGVVLQNTDDEDFIGDLVIPEKVTYKGRSYTVTAIGKRTFVGCYEVQTVTIPNSITTIDESAFGDDGETGIYDVKVADDHPFYQVGGEIIEDSTMTLMIGTTKLIDKRTQKVLWYTVEELLIKDPEEWVESDSEENDLDDDCEGIKTPIFRIPEIRAEFPGGMNALKEFLATNCHYPPHAREGRWQGCVMLEFVVETDGRISCIKVLRSVVSFLDEEAIRVVKAMPKWKPGQNYGQPCRSYFQLPVAFWLQ